MSAIKEIPMPQKPYDAYIPRPSQPPLAFPVCGYAEPRGSEVRLDFIQAEGPYQDLLERTYPPQLQGLVGENEFYQVVDGYNSQIPPEMKKLEKEYDESASSCCASCCFPASSFQQKIDELKASAIKYFNTVNTETFHARGVQWSMRLEMVRRGGCDVRVGYVLVETGVVQPKVFPLKLTVESRLNSLPDRRGTCPPAAPPVTGTLVRPPPPVRMQQQPPTSSEIKIDPNILDGSEDEELTEEEIVAHMEKLAAKKQARIRQEKARKAASSAPPPR